MNRLQALHHRPFLLSPILIVFGAVTALALVELWSCRGPAAGGSTVTVEEIDRHIRALSDDRMEGRAVGTTPVEGM